MFCGGGFFKGVFVCGGFIVSVSWDSNGNFRILIIWFEFGNEVVVIIGKIVVGLDKGVKLCVVGESVVRFVMINGKKGMEIEVKGE